MTDIEKMKIDRRRVEIEISKVEDKLKLLKEEKKTLDNKITAMQLNDAPGNGFRTSVL